MLLDQRGAGKSVPNVSDDYEAALKNNTTPHLVDDIEALRIELGLDAWQLILGGSWGSTLALAYAQAHPSRVKQLLLRGVFTFLPDEVDTLFQNGRAADHYPDEWAAYTSYIRETSDDWPRERDNLVAAYRDRLLNPEQRMAAAAAFVTYELSISHLHKNQERIDSVMSTPEVLVPFAALEVHYMLFSGFMRRGQLLDEVAAIKDHQSTSCMAAMMLYASQGRRSSQRCSGGGRCHRESYPGVHQAAGHSDSEPPMSALAEPRTCWPIQTEYVFAFRPGTTLSVSAMRHWISHGFQQPLPVKVPTKVAHEFLGTDSHLHRHRCHSDFLESTARRSLSDERTIEENPSPDPISLGAESLQPR